jgi:membrane fusion protein (multidrug efflux system)
MNTMDRNITAVSENPKAIAMEDQPVIITNSPPPRLGRWIIIIAVILIAALIFGVVPRLLRRQALKTQMQDLSVMTVQVITPAPGKATAALSLPAEVRPYEEATIYARANGFVKHWYVDIGAPVKAGELLAVIDTPELDQQLDQARAQLEQAQAAQSLADLTAKRWADLVKTASVSDQENAEKQADLKLKVAMVDAAKADVERLQDLQSFSRGTAPFAGTLTARNIDVGDLISTGKELFRLADTSKLRVFVRVPQTATPGIAVGLGAEMTVQEMPARKFMAKVVRTAGAIDASSRTLLVELEVDNSKNELYAGTYAQVQFLDLKAEATIALPANTLLFRGQGLQVGVVGSDNHVLLHDITIGRDFGKTVEVLSGITTNDNVIVNPSDSLVSGTVVRVMEKNPADKTP